MIYAGTGHRPAKLGGYDIHSELVTYARTVLRNLELQPTRVISGMAIGWDLALAEAAGREGIPVSCYFPCRRHYSKWPESGQLAYFDIIQGLMCREGTEARYITNGAYTPACMQERNGGMVDDCDIVLALYNGSTGGTHNCIQYATTKKRPVINVWEGWATRRAA